MTGPEDLELLCSRYLDGDLDAEGRARVEAAIAADPALRATFDDMQRAHEGVAELAKAYTLPARFGERVVQSLKQALVHAMPVRRWSAAASAAAAIIAAIALVAIAAIVSNDGPVQPPVIGRQPLPDKRPKLEVAGFSSAEMRLTGADGAKHAGRNVRASVILPATVQAPADTHAVLALAGGTVVLAPGATARLADVDADGVPSLEPVSGDLYLEARTGKLASRIAEVRLKLLRSGITLRRSGAAFTADPSFGTVAVNGKQVAFRERATIADGKVEVSPFPDSALDAWAISGRVDAIQHELRTLLGDKYDRVMAAFWKYWEPLLRGVMSRPAEAATSALFIRFFVDHVWPAEWGENERNAARNIGNIISEGTTDADVPQKVRDMLARWEKAAEQNPEFARDALRRALERGANGKKPENGEHKPD